MKRRNRIYKVSLLIGFESIDKCFTSLRSSLAFVKDMSKEYSEFEFFVFSSDSVDPLCYSGIVKMSYVYFDVYNHKPL